MLNELSQIDGQGLVSSNDICGGEVSVLTRAAGECQGLQQRCPCLDWIYPRLHDLADEVDAVALDLLNHHRDVRVLHRRAEALGQLLGELRYGQVLRLDLSGERIRDLAVWTDDDRLFEFLVVPHDDVQDVIRADPVFILGRAGGDTGAQDAQHDQQAREERLHALPPPCSPALPGADVMVVLGVITARLAWR